MSDAPGTTESTPTPTLDVSDLPAFAFGARTPIFWGVVLLMAIETTMLALMVLSYFYVRGNFTSWPPTWAGDRSFHLATVGVALLVVSAVPNHLMAAAAVAGRIKRARTWLIVTTALGAAAFATRVLEFPRLQFRWDTHAYGSAVWGILGLNTFHQVTALAENLVMLALLLIGPVEQKHRHDLELGGYFWYWLIATTVPLYAIVYLEPLVFPR
jgi:cytochrome c oxidase subunit III